MGQSMAQTRDPPILARDRDRFQILSVQIIFSLAAKRRAPLPATLTLVYFPRISGASVEINDVEYCDNTPKFMELHRIRSSEALDGSDAAFLCTQRIWAGEGVSFDVYAGTEKILRGIFRGGVRWVVVFQSAEEKNPAKIGAMQAKLCVVMDGGVAMRERVLMMLGWQWRQQCRMRFYPKLEVIAEEEEGEAEVSDQDEEVAEDEKLEMRGLDCGHNVGRRMDGGDGMVIERIGWARGVGILVACFGVGLLICNSSLKRFRIF